MKYLKIDMLSSNIDNEIERHFPFMSFIEIDDLGYEKRRLNFHRDNAGTKKDYKISFIDEQGSYLGAWLPEHPWKSSNYSKKNSIFDINKYMDEPGFSFSFIIEIDKDKFDEVWSVVVEKYLLEECSVIRDEVEEPLIDFNNLPDQFNQEQLEYLVETYTVFKNDLNKEHIQQIQEYITKNST